MKVYPQVCQDCVIFVHGFQIHENNIKFQTEISYLVKNQQVWFSKLMKVGSLNTEKFNVLIFTIQQSDIP